MGPSATANFGEIKINLVKQNFGKNVLGATKNFGAKKLAVTNLAKKNKYLEAKLI